MFAARALVTIAATAVGMTMAQSPASPSAAESSVCMKPGAHPGHLASDARKKQWAKDVNAWNECMRAHISELQERATAAIAVANKAIEEFNRAAKEFQQQSSAESGQ
jgi:hypothetical protein